MYEHIAAVLEEDVEAARARVKATGGGATATADGVWDTRGHFAQNGTYVITDKDWLNALLAYKHASKRGTAKEDGPADGEIWGGTSHSMEGHLSDLCCQDLRAAGVQLDKLWMDGDSSADTCFRRYFPDVVVRRCCGHKVKNLAKNLSNAAKRKTPDGKNQVQMLGLSCCCSGKNHSPDCGCLKEFQVMRIRLMTFGNAVAAGTDPAAFATRCHALADYFCGEPATAIGLKMVPAMRCVCKNCVKWGCLCGHCPSGQNCNCHGEALEPTCAGAVPYECPSPITCEFHAKEVQMHLAKLASEAEEMIDSKTGKGDSNGSEGKFNVLPRFREKGSKLQLRHYCCSTDLGLLQGNVLAAKALGLEHWVLRVLKRAGLPIAPAQRRRVEQALITLIKAHRKRQEPAVMRARCVWRRGRALDSQQRREFSAAAAAAAEGGPLAPYAYQSELLAMEEDEAQQELAQMEFAGSDDMLTHEHDLQEIAAAGHETQLASAAAAEQLPVVPAAAAAARRASSSSSGSLRQLEEPDPTAPVAPARPPAEFLFSGLLDDYICARGRTVLVFKFDLEATDRNHQLASITEIAAEAWLLTISAGDPPAKRQRRAGGEEMAAAEDVAAAQAGLSANYTVTWTRVDIAPFQVDVRPYALPVAQCLAVRRKQAGAGAQDAEEQLTPNICSLTSFTQDRAAAGKPFPAAWVAFMAWAGEAKAAAGAHDFGALLAHNGNLFDVPLMLQYGAVHGVDVYASLVELGISAVADSLVWARKLVNWPEEKARNKNGEPVVNQSALHEYFFPGEGYRSHTAPGDVSALSEIIRTVLFTETAAECAGRLFVTLGQHATRQQILLEKWERNQGGYGRSDPERGLCRCMAVMQSFVVPASDHRAEGRRFRCPRVPRKDEVEADSKRAGEGCT